MAETISIKDLAKWPEKVIRKYHGLIMTTAEQTLSIEGMQIIQNTIDETQPYKPVNTGGYRRKWRVSSIPGGFRLGNSDKISPIIEDGRRPGKGVSLEGQEALARWAHLHGMDKVTMRERSTAQERARLRLTRKVGQGYYESVKASILDAREQRMKEGQRKAIRTARALGGTALRMARAGQRQRFNDAMEKKARTVAFLIARAIKRRGLPAKQVLGRAKDKIVNVVLSNIRAAMIRGYR